MPLARYGTRCVLGHASRPLFPSCLHAHALYKAPRPLWLLATSSRVVIPALPFSALSHEPRRQPHLSRHLPSAPTLHHAGPHSSVLNAPLRSLSTSGKPQAPAATSSGSAPSPARPKSSRIAQDHARMELTQGLSPSAAYERLAQEGFITHDSHQRAIVEHLDALFFRLQSYTPRGWKPSAFSLMYAKFKAWLKWRQAQNDPSSLLLKPPPPPTVIDESYKSLPDAPLGLYMHGDVGTGKTFLMDLFFDQCAHIEKKRRVHFHAFMLDVHRRIHAWKSKKGNDSDPIPPLAYQLASEAWLLCFDEFQVTDIADAMILHRLFFYLWCNGVVLVATSNRIPDELYKGGLQRPQFLPFIDSLKHRAQILNLDSGVDYRLRGTAADQVYLSPITKENNDAFEHLFQALTHHQKPKENYTITVQGRSFLVPRSVGGIAMFSFKDLCCKPHGAADYIALCEQFHTVFVRDIPEMTVAQKTEAKRLLVFIDAMYEHKCKLLCTAANTPDKLFGQKPPDENELNDTLVRQEREFLDALKLDHTTVDIFSGQEELFQFARAVSRLKEMQTKEYMSQSKWVYSHDDSK